MIESRRITIALDGTRIDNTLHWPHRTTVTAVQPSLDPSCAVVGCIERAEPANTIEAVLDVFGSPRVRVCMCDSHYELFSVKPHEVPDIAVEEHE